jgi:hypothetical protein
MSPSRLVVAVAAAFLLPVSPVRAQLPTPVLDAVFPPGAAAGSTVEVRVSGTDLDDLQGLRASHPGITAERFEKPADRFWPEPRPDGPRFRVTVAPDVPPGLHELRAVGHFGLSTPRLFEVRPAGEAAVLHPGPPHVAPDAPFPITLEQSVSGKLAPQQAHYFRIDLRRGQRVVGHLRAATLDSRLDARLALLDSGGQETIAVRGTGERDPHLAFTAPADGSFVIRLHDLLYRGGDAYFYRFTVSEQPFAETIVPLAARSGTRQRFTWIGPHLAASSSPWNDSRRETLSLDAEVPPAPPRPPLNGLKAARSLIPVTEFRGVPLGLTDLPVLTEEQAREQPFLPVPGEVSGWIDFVGNLDTYRFQAQTGKAYLVEAISHRQGQDTDLALAVRRVVAGPDGGETLEAAGESDDLFAATYAGFDARVRDPSLTFTAKADGPVQVEVANLTDESGPTQGYRLVVREAAPDLALFAVEERNHLAQNQAFPGVPNLAPGHRAAVHVVAIRSGGLVGPVHLSAKGLPPGVTALPAVIWPQATDGWLVLETAPDAAPGPVSFEIAATCGDLARTARPASLKWGVANVTTERAASRATAGLALAVTPAAAPPLRLDVDPLPGPVDLGQDVTFRVRVARSGALKGPVTVVPVGLPGFNQPPSLTIAEKDTEASFKISLKDAGNNKPTAGSGTVVFRATATAAGFPTHPEALERLRSWKTFQDAAIAALAPDDAAGQKAGTAARAELDQLLKAATERAKPRDLPFSVFSAPVELTISSPPKPAP